MNNWPHPVALLSLAALLLFLGLGSVGLTDRDEGSNAEAAREMAETGDWITPTLNYEPRFAKPVFVYWLMSGAYRLVGVNEFAARLPSALFGVALILLQYLFLTRVRGPVLGLLGGLMLLLSPEMVAIARMALTDSVLIFFTTLALFGPTEPLVWGPRSRRACVIRLHPPGPLTLENLPPEVVIEVLEALHRGAFRFAPSAVDCTLLDVPG